jgi:two-component system, cell cycle response regulator
MTLSSEHSLADERVFPLLIADENPTTRATLRDLASQWGYRAFPVERGAEVLQLLERLGSPQIAIISNSLPDGGGIPLCKRIREARLAYYPYLILASNRSDEKELVLAFESGADDYVAKPFDPAALKARLHAARRIHAMQHKWMAADEELRTRAALDELTGLWNRASLRDLLTRELDRARTAHLQTGLLILDLDHFKNVNDTHGHQAGDAVLKEAASRIRHSVRFYDFVGRLGGEEFCIVLPGCSDDQLRRRAEMIRMAVSSQPFRVGAAAIPLTMSLGATVVPPGDVSLSAALLRADVALYRAKAAGRNITVHCSRPAADFQFDIKSFNIHCMECPAAHASGCIVPRSADLEQAKSRNPRRKDAAFVADQALRIVR